MRRKTVYSDAPREIDKALDDAVRIKDFLPSPEELIAKENSTTKVTLALTNRSLMLFRKYARKHGAKYQHMIRRLVDIYAQHSLARKM
jgi:predicted DNA binding CopG/RHH family protein